MKMKNISFFLILLFEMRSRFFLLYLVLQDKINISNFENRTRNKKLFLTVEREFLILILTRIFKIENSRNALLPGPQNLF